MATLTPDEIAYQTAHINEDQGPKVIGVSSFLIALTTVVVGLRFVARKTRKLHYGWDDAFSLAGLIGTICMCIINIVSVHYGLGKHLLATNPAQGYKILEAGFFLSLDYAITHWFIKMAILLTYIRIFTLNQKWFKYAVYFTIFYVSAWAFSLAMTIVTQCRPLNFFWQQYNLSLDPPATGVCTINSNATEVSTSALNSVADFILLVLPLTVLWKLQLSLKKKLGVMAIFLIGIFACIAGILRLVSTLTVIAAGKDSTWDTVGVYLWTAVEAAVGLLCACFPIIGPLYPLATEKLRSLTTNTSNRSLFSSSKQSKSYSRDQGYQLHSKQPRSWNNTKDSSNVSQQSIDIEPIDVPAGSVMRTDSYTVTRSAA